MKYNERISTEYGENDVILGSSPIAYQPKPTVEDYKKGYFIRWLSQRVNELKAIEIDPNTAGDIDSNLYKTISLTWIISGPKNRITTNGIIDRYGVVERNQSEILRVKKEDNVDLTKTLTNPLELWRGY